MMTNDEVLTAQLQTSTTVAATKITVLLPGRTGQRVYIIAVDWETDLTTGIVELQGGGAGITLLYAKKNAASGDLRFPFPIPLGNVGVNANVVVPCTTTGRVNVAYGYGQ